MNLRGRNKNDNALLSIPTSMIDVTFLLLIFFICSARFKTPEGNLETQLKDGGHGPVVFAEEVRIRIFREKGTVVTYLNQIQCSNDQDLFSRLNRIHKLFPENRVIIDSKKDVPYQKVVDALNACVRANITDFSFAMPRDIKVGN